MPIKTYRKLVHNRIPEIIEPMGKTASAKRSLTRTTYLSWTKN